jgi:hypothetical protein
VTQIDLMPIPAPSFGLARFNGPVYAPEHDQPRLARQVDRVFDAMKDGEWRTLSEIAAASGAPEASVSAQIRHLGKPRFGSHAHEKRPRGERERGLWEYRLIVHL